MSNYVSKHRVKGNVIFCNACRVVVSSKKSVLVSHYSSKKHVSGKDKLKMSKLTEQTIVEAVSREKSQKGSTLLLTERGYRQEVVEEFLKAEIPIPKIDTLRPLEEKNGYRLTGCSNLGQYISLIFKQEMERLKRELALPGSPDGTRDVLIAYSTGRI